VLPSFFGGLGMIQVIVGNVGTVYEGDDEKAARRMFEDYLWLSQQNSGRAAGESVAMIEGGVEIDFYAGRNFSGEEE
jgi:hypothetical protein